MCLIIRHQESNLDLKEPWFANQSPRESNISKKTCGVGHVQNNNPEILFGTSWLHGHKWRCWCFFQTKTPAVHQRLWTWFCTCKTDTVHFSRMNITSNESSTVSRMNSPTIMFLESWCYDHWNPQSLQASFQQKSSDSQRIRPRNERILMDMSSGYPNQWLGFQPAFFRGYGIR